MTVILKGALVSGTLIIAIGSQNAFVLRQGLSGSHVLPVVLTCFLCDVLLMTLGIFGVGTAVGSQPTVSAGLALAGAGFLFWYGARAFVRALTSTQTLQPGSRNGASARWNAVGATLAVTLLNPHVYLDTVVIVGGITVGFTSAEKLRFLLGALLASLAWFLALGYGARLLQPVFQTPRAWRVLDGLIGTVMWWIAVGLMRHGLSQLPALQWRP